MRPVSVTRLAPMRTPIIPSTGRPEIFQGIALAVACAISSGVGGRLIVVEAAINNMSGYTRIESVTGLLSRADNGGNGESRTQIAGLIGIIEYNLHGDSLYHFRKI